MKFSFRTQILSLHISKTETKKWSHFPNLEIPPHLNLMEASENRPNPIVLNALIIFSDSFQSSS